MLNIVRNIDCMKFMEMIPDKHFDLSIVDPPFPIRIEGGGRFRNLMKKKIG